MPRFSQDVKVLLQFNSSAHVGSRHSISPQIATVDAVTRPNIGTPALASAKLATVIAAAKDEPLLSKTVV